VRTFIPGHQTSAQGSNTACGRLHGNANEMEDLFTDEFPTIDDTYGIETFLVIGSGAVTVIADFRDERLEFRVRTTIPPPAGTTGAVVGTPVPSSQHLTPVPKPIVTPAGVVVAPGANSQGSTPIVTNNQLTLPVLKKATPKKKASLVFVRMVKPLKQNAARSVVLRVKSSKKIARIQVKLIGARGKVLGMTLRSVKTNRTVTVPNLRLPRSVVNVRVKLIA
jgi:hypothetical protein